MNALRSLGLRGALCPVYSGGKMEYTEGIWKGG